MSRFFEEEVGGRLGELGLLAKTLREERLAALKLAFGRLRSYQGFRVEAVLGFAPEKCEK